MVSLEPGLEPVTAVVPVAAGRMEQMHVGVDAGSRASH